jgi:tungstate transport system substrate-binding protein
MLARSAWSGTVNVLRHLGLLVCLGAIVAACGPAATASPQSAIESGSPVTSPASAGSPAATTTGGGSLILATTTSLRDSGLLDLLVPAFEASGVAVKTVAVGTGQALTMGKEGNADVLFVHAPAQEATFVDEGWGVDRRLVAHNYFWIVGPAADPAGVKSATTAKDAFARIAASKASFVSRGDKSGTNTKELAIWKDAGVTPSGSWYIESGQGMGPTLQIASEKSAYTLTDTATYLANQSNLQLEALLKDDKGLINIYSVITVNPAKWPKANAAGAKAFADFVTGTDGQQIIGTFGAETYGAPLFIADAGKAYDSLK